MKIPVQVNILELVMDAERIVLTAVLLRYQDCNP